MARRPTLYLPVRIVAAVMMACAVALLAVSQKAEATFPGKNGRIAYSAFDLDGGVDETIYTIKPGGELRPNSLGATNLPTRPTAKGSPTRCWVKTPLAMRSLRTPKAFSPVPERDPPTTPARSSS